MYINDIWTRFSAGTVLNVSLTILVLKSYALLKKNAECDKRASLTADASATVGLQECFALAEQSDFCAEELVEWGNSNTFDPDSTGYCLCYSEGVYV